MSYLSHINPNDLARRSYFLCRKEAVESSPAPEINDGFALHPPGYHK
jgi:hypothetical protein